MNGAPLIPRTADTAAVRRLLDHFPVTAIIGPRQSGKTTLARQFKADYVFDLENPRDLAILEQPQTALESLEGLILIDEIQRRPELFPLIRYLVDARARQRYLILGSASRDLLRQSSESLAGRIAYFELHGLRLCDVGPNHWRKLWWRGGLPPAYTAKTDDIASEWLEQYIATFLERDLPQLGFSISASTMRRFWTMLCHYHGQILNYAELGRAFGISDMTVRRYVDVLESTFVVRLLQPWQTNLSKRLVKRPKLYLRDAGLLHTLLAIRSERDLAAHNKLGASWEGFALETAARAIGGQPQSLYFWATHTGAEVDIFWQERGRNWAIEVKYADAPKLTPSMSSALADLELERLWILYPGNQTYSLHKRVTVLPLAAIGKSWNYRL